MSAATASHTLPRQIERSDIMSMEDYGRIRDQRRKEMARIKRDRRIHVGPDITFYFENYATMLHQVHEMLYVERGGEAQIADELAAYNPLIPQGRELVATMMIEVEDPQRRERMLLALGGIEETISLEVADQTIAAVAETDVERTTAEGKTSSVHFLRFPFDEAAAASFRMPGTRILLAIGHRNYQHIAVIPEAVRASLAADLDDVRLV